MRHIFLLVLAGLVFTQTAAADKQRKERPVKPLSAPSVFLTENYILTFRVPEPAYYCPLPKDWVGSDHGTVIFFVPPKECYGAGYPSSGRGFEPADTPRIEVFYAYDLDEEERPAPPVCATSGTAVLFGKSIPLCQEPWQGMVAIKAEGRYVADQPAMLIMTLVVKPADVQRFLPAFKTMLASVRTCQAAWALYDKQGKMEKSGTFGHGPRCPAGNWF